MTRPYLAIVALIILALPFSTVAQTIVLDDYITDETGVLLYSGHYEETWEMCRLMEEETSVQIAILVINSTEGRDIAEYSIEIFNENGLGQENEDNGILIVAAIGDETYFVSVGRGLEGVLNDAKIGRFARDNYVPNADIGDWGYGLNRLTAAIILEILDNYEGEPQKDPYPISWIPLKTWQLVLVIVIFVVLAVVTKGRILIFPWIFSRGKGGRDWGGGRTGGGGAGGKL